MFFSAGGVDLPIDALRGDGLAGLSRSQSGGVGGERTEESVVDIWVIWLMWLKQCHKPPIWEW